METIMNTPWHQRPGEVETRVILRNMGGYQPYATHIECRSLSGTTYCVHGHYFVNLDSAIVDYGTRVAREYGD